MIVLKKISKSFGDVSVVKEVSLEAVQNSSTVILGPSGTGKTTLLRLIAGLEIPDGGEIYLDGALASKPGWALAPYRRGIGFVFQTSALLAAYDRGAEYHVRAARYAEKRGPASP